MAESQVTQTLGNIDIGSVGGGAPAAATAPAPRQAAVPDRGGFVWGTGRRKTAVARVRVKPGQGKFLVNDREVNKFFTELRDQEDAVSPLKVTKTQGSLDVFVNVHGGGYMGQAGAVKLGLSRALMGYDPSLEPILRDNNMLTRDPRKVERKKYGQSGARKRFQFSKR
ncbi:MAG: 30S ribosomal protein S9 [Phycisphaeraceae bacterium]|nr:30S ribosomal protein S9 [Phycisphaeraceae bacterium]